MISTQLTAFSSLPVEVQQQIIGLVGAPTKTSLVSKLWQKQTGEVVKVELKRIFQYLKPRHVSRLRKNLDFDEIQGKIKEIYQKTVKLVPRDIALHFPPFSFERFLEGIKIEDTLTFWKCLPYGSEYVDQQDLRGLSLAEIREQLSVWIEQTPLVKNRDRINLCRRNLRYLPPEIGQLTKVWLLLLDQNQLRELPPEISKLTNLTQLDLAMNPLTELPKTLESSKVQIQLSSLRDHFVSADIVCRFFQLSDKNKDAVMECIAPGNTRRSGPRDFYFYSACKVFDSEVKLVEAMEEVMK